MIVHPNFPEHWKTRLLVEITKDESAPLAVIRFWAHCQQSKRWEFPDMTPAQLASICRWGARKPACHVALSRAGFVDKLTPRGFAAHQWGENNGQLLQKWNAGEKGGRPRKEENTNELPLNEKPTVNRPLTGPVPDKTRPDQISQDKPSQVQPSPDASQFPKPLVSPPRMDSVEKVACVAGTGLEGLPLRKRVLPFTPPTLQQVEAHLRLHFGGAERYAAAFHKTMTEQHWRDKDGGEISNWQRMANAYASKCALNQNK